MRTAFSSLAIAALALGSAQAQRPESDVVAGLALRVTAPARADTVVYRRSITRDGVETDMGLRTVVVQGTAAKDGSPQLQVVQKFPGSVGMIVDTMIADARSLRAVAHRSHQATRKMRFTFSGAVAEGEVVETTSGASGGAGASGAATGSSEESQDHMVKQVVGGPIFDLKLLETVVSAMPLAAGFKTSVPFFVYESGGRVVMTVAVKERASVQFAAHGARDVWVVSVAIPGSPATLWVDSATNTALRVQYDIPPRHILTTEERQTRLP